MPMLLHKRYIDAILNNPAGVALVHDAINKEEAAIHQRLEDQFAFAKQLVKVMRLPEDDPGRVATVAYLRALQGGEKNE